MDPIDKIKIRLESSRNDSDVAYFYDSLLYGEFITKLCTLFLVSAVNDDKERTRYRQEYQLARANAIGDFAKSIDDILTGPAAQLLNSVIRDYEMKELMQRCGEGMWQYECQQLLYKCFDVFEIENEALPAKSALKNWFNQFAFFRNKTRGHGAPRVVPSAKASIYLVKSIDLIVDNFTMFKRPWAHLHQNLSGKYRVSMFNTKKSTEFDYLKKETQHLLPNGVYCFIDHPRKINFFHSNPELTDYYITNGNLKSNAYECLSYITDERIVVDASSYLLPVTELPESHTEGTRNLDVVGNCFTNIPKPTDQYVSRSSLQNELKKVLLEDDRFPIVTLVGRGGIGKTSLTLNVIHELLNHERFNIILWFSSRDIDLLHEGPKQVHTRILNPKDISDEYCSLVYGKVNKDSPDIFAREMTKCSLGKALFVFDNFETLTNPVETYEWINTYIRNPNKVLITSRISRNFKADYPIEVRGMSENESKILIDLYSSKLKIESLITSDYIEDLISESDGHPYIIKILLGEVSKAQKRIKVERIVADQEKILTALFKRTFNTLSPAAKRVFLTLASWNSLIPKIAVEAVLWRPENERMDIESKLEELMQCSFIELIDTNNEQYINVPLAAIIFGRSELEVYPEKIKILDDRKLLMEFGATSQNSLSSGLISRIERKFSAIAKRTSSVEQFQKELPTLEYIASKFPRTYEFIIQIFQEFGDFRSVKYYIREYLKYPILPSEKASLWLKLSNICKMTNDWDGESNALAELAIIPSVPFVHISEAGNRINQYFYQNPDAKNVDHKKALLDKVIEVMKKRITEGSATDYSRLGWLLVNNDMPDNAIAMAENGLEIDPYNQHCQRLISKLTNVKK